MREIILDTETTGLDPARGHRIVEVGAVELLNRFPTGQTFQAYINPERDMPPEAQAVHGLSSEFLRGKPLFKAIAAELLDFIGDAVLVIHNAAFDVGFLNAEFAAIGRPPLAPERIVDTLMLARQKHPMGPNSLDALCKRYGVDNTRRRNHGALLDSELLADVYIELTGGRQAGLGLTSAMKPRTLAASNRQLAARPAPLAPRLTEAEREAHAAMVAKLGPDALWGR